VVFQASTSLSSRAQKLPSELALLRRS
jgi:hypothetical protein